MFGKPRTKWERAEREFFRLFLLVAIGLALINFSPALAIAWAIPALSPWGLFLGGMLLVGAVSHVMRRVLFPKLDLQSIAKKAIGDRDDSPNLPAAVVFAAICSILGLLLYLNASMLRM